MTERILIAGCGYIGRRIARLARDRGLEEVDALTRNPANLRHQESGGVRIIQGDLDDSAPLHGLPTRNSTVFYLVPPPGGGNLDTRIRVFLASIEPGDEPAKIIYIGTSGVYGDCHGETVTEETPVNAGTARARRRLDAESILTAWASHRGVDVVRLRVAGIYGPERLPLDRIRKGEPVLREEDAPLTNRIHADDLARICLAAAEKIRNGEIYNVSDSHPTTMTYYFNAVADATGLARPPQVSLAEASGVMSPLMLSYFSESRRMDNSKMLNHLNMSLRYPDLESGLDAIRKEDVEAG